MTDMALVKLNQAELMLSEARTIQDVKQVLDVVEAVRIYAKRAKLGTRTINSAVQFKIEAERRLGDMLKQMPKNEGTRGQLKGDVPVGTSITAGPTDNTPTLAEIGITYKQSTRAQHLADLSPEVVAAHCNEQNERGEEITVTGVPGANDECGRWLHGACSKCWIDPGYWRYPSSTAVFHPTPAVPDAPGRACK